MFVLVFVMLVTFLFFVSFVLVVLFILKQKMLTLGTAFYMNLDITRIKMTLFFRHFYFLPKSSIDLKTSDLSKQSLFHLYYNIL